MHREGLPSNAPLIPQGIDPAQTKGLAASVIGGHYLLSLLGLLLGLLFLEGLKFGLVRVDEHVGLS